MKYMLNENDEIIAIHGEWSEFANENNAAELSNESKLIGKSIWKFIRSPEIQSVYRHIFEKVRLSEKSIAMPFRCDSPNLRRFMELVVSPEGGDYLLVKTRLNYEERRDYQSVLDSTLDSGENTIWACSVCRRFSESGAEWLEIEDLANSTNIFTEDTQPKLKETVCNDCTNLVQDLDRIVSFSSNSLDRTQALPLVVFIHGELQQDFLLRLNAIPRQVASGSTKTEVPFVLLSVIKRYQGPWKTDHIEKAIDHTLEHFSIDRDRIYLTGISSGGQAVWKLIGEKPQKYAAAVPLACNPLLGVDQVHTKIPIWTAVNREDQLVNLDSFQSGIGLLQNRGVSIVSEIYDAKGHDCWSAA